MAWLLRCMVKSPDRKGDDHGTAAAREVGPGRPRRAGTPGGVGGAGRVVEHGDPRGGRQRVAEGVQVDRALADRPHRHRVANHHRHPHAGRMAGQPGQAEDLPRLVPELQLLDRVAVLVEAHALRDHVERQRAREDLAGRQGVGAAAAAQQLAVADQLGGLLGQLVHATLPGTAGRLERRRGDGGQAEQVPQHRQHRCDRQRGAVGVGDDADRVLPDRLGVDVRVDQRHLRVHAPGAGVVDHHGAAFGGHRRPLA